MFTFFQRIWRPKNVPSDIPHSWETWFWRNHRQICKEKKVIIVISSFMNNINPKSYTCIWKDNILYATIMIYIGKYINTWKKNNSIKC